MSWEFRQISGDSRRFRAFQWLSPILYPILWGAIALSLAPLPAQAGTIDTHVLEQPWRREVVRELEVGRHEVRWRQKASNTEGIFAGVRFTAPYPRQAVWDVSSDYSDVGTMTPGVTAVRFLERSPERQVIQVDVKVLWKTLTLTFEVEQEPPTAMRFRLRNELLGEFRGVSIFEEVPTPGGGATTAVELSTWLKPSRPVPVGLLLIVERMTLLRGVERFLDTCDQSLR